VCKKHGAKRYERKLCSNEGCTNIAQRGGVCWTHGAKVKCKLCSSDGCANQAILRGVCWRHGANRNPNDESTAFALSRESAFDATTATLPNQRTTAASRVRETSSIPPQVILCQVIDYVEV
jgi:hypothetical protein